MNLQAAFAAAALVITVAPCFAEWAVEDFEAGRFGGFDDQRFVHHIGYDEIVGATFNWAFSNQEYISPVHSLWLAPGGDHITFDLADGQYVDYVEVWMRGDELLPAQVHIFGLDDQGQQMDRWYSTRGLEPWVFISSEGAGFSSISEVRLTSIKNSMFDDVAINIVPEPVSLAMLLTGIAGLGAGRGIRLSRLGSWVTGKRRS